MTKQGFLVGAGMVILAGLWLCAGTVQAQSMAEYTATPPSVSNFVRPNVLLLLDKSGSMGRRADCDKSSGSDFSTCNEFEETKVYPGIFDSLKCYTYDGANTRFESSGAAKAAIGSACANTLWDGNFLNWVTFRRVDAVKQALMGGSCAVARNTDGTCPPSGTGSPKKITMKGVDTKVRRSGGDISTPAVPVGPGSKKSNGRVPASLEVGTTDLYFHLIGEDSALTGSFCTDNESDEPEPDPPDCSTKSDGSDDSDGYVEQPFKIRVVVDLEPTGLIQDAGDKVRFGLMEFKGNDGAQVLVSIGGRQTVEWNGTQVRTFTSNTLAMIDALEDTNNEGNTPLAESLYEALRYVAQVNSSLFPSEYVYPIAYSPGVGYKTAGAGSVGPQEISALIGSETCPGGYLADACGRDPYFFGSNHTPAWASPSVQVPCCKTFILILTDGAPTEDQDIPSSLQDYAHAHHGLHCTPGSSTIHTPDGTCNTNDATPPATLLGEHNTDYGSGSHYLDDVAFWGHTNDLRQATIPVINETGHDLPGDQTVTIYTFFAFGNITGREIMMHTAKLGGFEDLNGNNIPDLTSEWDTKDNDTGAQTPDGIPDTYFESSNGADIKDKLLSTVASILQRSASGSAASVLASSSTGEGAVYQSFFFPDTVENFKDIKWTGYTQALFVDTFGNLREDSDGDGRLVYKNDKIVATRFDTSTNEVVADLFVDVSPADGKADSSTPTASVGLKAITPIWEAGKLLALRDLGANPRNILTWIDKNNDGAVDGGEQVAFSTTNSSDLSPYLRPGAAPFTADNIINFVRGDQIAGLRDRQLTVNGNPETWRLGDSIHASPVIVAAPQERYDFLYGDPSYLDFFLKYKHRRQVVYVGGNDGMLHAFNAGFYHKGDDSGTTAEIERGYFTTAPNDNNSGAKRGEELWGFIPQELLPHLQWLARPDYSHVYYVDLQPKVTDARLFTDDGPNGLHPGGWGTILIGGFRLGGSCQACASGTGAPPMQVTADFGLGVETRTFYSAYFVLDITDPERDPTLLWVFTDPTLGLTTSRPAVVRVSTSTNASDNANAKWVFTVGSGSTQYAGESTQDGKMFALEMPKPYAAGSSLVPYEFPTTVNKLMVADLISIDKDLDYRADTLYGGTAIRASNPDWQGIMYRLTTGSGSGAPATWGVTIGSDQRPSEVLATYTCWPRPCVGNTTLGPVTSAPAVTLDDGGNFWLFFGTGRYYTQADKVFAEPQYFVGLKDPVMSGGCTESSVKNCEQNDLVKITNATICIVCTGGTDQVTGVSGVTTLKGSTTDTLQGLVQSKDGWFTDLTSARERVIFSPTLQSGIVFFPSFTPIDDICVSSGDSKLYALFYLTGSAYTQSVIGTETVGGNTNVLGSISLGTGLASQAQIHIGSQGTDTGSGVAGRVKVCSQTSSGAVTCVTTNPPQSSWSHYMSWISQSI